MSRLILIVCILIEVSVNGSIYAQKWGKVTREELEMTALPEAPNASAIILFDKAEMRVTLDFKRIFERHCRIKILSEQGKKYADVSIVSSQEDEISNIKAQSILPNGKKIKLNRKQIYEEGNELIIKKVFAIPGVEVGAIIEYRYLIVSHSLMFIEPWYFQNNDFTKLSEFSVILPDGFKYKAFFPNAIKDAPKPVKTKLWSHENRHIILYQYSWKMENLQPIHPESFMGNPIDYLNSLYFQIVSFEDKQKIVHFTANWYYFEKILKKYFNQFLDVDRGLKKLLENVLSDTITGINRAKLVYNYVRDEIILTQDVGIFSNLIKKPHEVIANKHGNAVEKNLLLINLLRKAGFKSNPVMIRTRDQGKFYEEFTQITQFNHVLAHLKISDDDYFLDCSNKYCPFGILPSNLYVQKAVLFDETNVEIIPIPHPKEINMCSVSTEANLNVKGDLCCHTKIEFKGWYGMMERGKLDIREQKEYIEHELKDHFDIFSLDSCHITNIKQIDEPLSIEIYYNLPEYSQINNDLLYLSPALLYAVESNPFKGENRILPIEFDHTFLEEEKVEFNLQGNLQILELPKSMNLIQPDFSFTTKFENDSDRIIYSREFNLRKINFQSYEYRALQNLFERIINADQGQIVLKIK